MAKEHSWALEDMEDREALLAAVDQACHDCAKELKNAHPDKAQALKRQLTKFVVLEFKKGVQLSARLL